MLRRNLRLKQKSHFRAIFTHGKSFSGRYVVIYVQNGPAKYGFIASKRVGSAVQRNRAKRLMREVVRRHLSELKKEVQLICIARSTLKGISYVEVENSMLQTLKRAGVITRDKESMFESSLND